MVRAAARAVFRGRWFGGALLLAWLLLTVSCANDTVEPPRVLPTVDYWPEDRLAWRTSSVPAALAGFRDGEAAAQRRVDTIRWFRPREPVLAGHLDPDLGGPARDQALSALQLYLRADDGVWAPDAWGGIMAGRGHQGVDIRRTNTFEIWVNDFHPDPADRRGVLHIDFGFLGEDHVWPTEFDGPRYGTWEDEDWNDDDIFTQDEDTGLGDINDAEPFDPTWGSAADPYPGINSTNRNNQWDTEDVDGDGAFEWSEGYFSYTLDLAVTAPFIDVVRDHEDVADLVAENLAWRCYRFDLWRGEPVDRDLWPDHGHVTHLRIWYEDAADGAPEVVNLQFANTNFILVEDPKGNSP